MTEEEFSLKIVDGKLSLILPDMKPFSIDFLSAKMQKRAQIPHHELVVKACKVKPNTTIIDMSAGLGRDAFLLASAGASVQMLERHPIVYPLLEDALKRLKEVQPEINLSLLNIDSQDHIKNLKPKNHPDIIYFDPMHPERKKSAQVKKDMQLLQALIGEDKDKKHQAQQAKTKCKKLIIKWPRKEKPLLDNVAYSYGDKVKGGSIRFDVYTTGL